MTAFDVEYIKTKENYKLLSQSDFDTQTLSNMLFQRYFLIVYLLTLTGSNEVEARYAANFLDFFFSN